MFCLFDLTPCKVHRDYRNQIKWSKLWKKNFVFFQLKTARAWPQRNLGLYRMNNFWISLKKKIFVVWWKNLTIENGEKALAEKCFFMKKLIQVWLATTFDLPFFCRILRATIYGISWARRALAQTVNLKFWPPITPPGDAKCKN